jgi:hypothetical protein
MTQIPGRCRGGEGEARPDAHGAVIGADGADRLVLMPVKDELEGLLHAKEYDRTL